MRLTKKVNQSHSGAPGVDIISREDSDFMCRMSFLQNHINRRKRCLLDCLNVWCINNELSCSNKKTNFCNIVVFHRSTAGNFGPGQAQIDVSADTVVTLETQPSPDIDSSEDEPLATYCNKGVCFLFVPYKL